jgi:hypothetical protein
MTDGSERDTHPEACPVPVPGGIPRTPARLTRAGGLWTRRAAPRGTQVTRNRRSDQGSDVRKTLRTGHSAGSQ